MLQYVPAPGLSGDLFDSAREELALDRQTGIDVFGAETVYAEIDSSIISPTVDRLRSVDRDALQAELDVLEVRVTTAENSSIDGANTLRAEKFLVEAVLAEG